MQIGPDNKDGVVAVDINTQWDVISKLLMDQKILHHYFFVSPPPVSVETDPSTGEEVEVYGEAKLSQHSMIKPKDFKSLYDLAKVEFNIQRNGTEDTHGNKGCKVGTEGCREYGHVPYFKGEDNGEGVPIDSSTIDVCNRA